MGGGSGPKFLNPLSYHVCMDLPELGIYCMSVYKYAGMIFYGKWQEIAEK